MTMIFNPARCLPYVGPAGAVMTRVGNVVTLSIDGQDIMSWTKISETMQDMAGDDMQGMDGVDIEGMN